MEDGIQFETPKSSFMTVKGDLFLNMSPLAQGEEIILNTDQIVTIYKRVNGFTAISMQNGQTIYTDYPFDKFECEIMQKCNFIGKI